MALVPLTHPLCCKAKAILKPAPCCSWIEPFCPRPKAMPWGCPCHGQGPKPPNPPALPSWPPGPEGCGTAKYSAGRELCTSSSTAWVQPSTGGYRLVQPRAAGYSHAQLGTALCRRVQAGTDLQIKKHPHPPSLPSFIAASGSGVLKCSIFWHTVICVDFGTITTAGGAGPGCGRGGRPGWLAQAHYYRCLLFGARGPPVPPPSAV